MRKTTTTKSTAKASPKAAAPVTETKAAAAPAVLVDRAIRGLGNGNMTKKEAIDLLEQAKDAIKATPAPAPAAKAAPATQDNTLGKLGPVLAIQGAEDRVEAITLPSGQVLGYRAICPHCQEPALALFGQDTRSTDAYLHVVGGCSHVLGADHTTPTEPVTFGTTRILLVTPKKGA